MWLHCWSSAVSFPKEANEIVSPKTEHSSTKGIRNSRNKADLFSRELKWFHESPNFLKNGSTNIRDHLLGPFHCTGEDSQIQEHYGTSGIEVLVLFPDAWIPSLFAHRAALLHALPPATDLLQALLCPLLSMCSRGWPSHNRKCRDFNLLHHACRVIPWPRLACQTQTTTAKTTQRTGVWSTGESEFPPQLPRLCLHILETGRFCNRQKRRESLMCLFICPQTGE